MDNIITNIYEVLLEEKELYQALLMLAKIKQEQIIAGDVAELLKTIDVEKETLQSIELEEERRFGLLEELEVDNTSFGQICEMADPKTTDKLRELRQELLVVLEELSEINDANKRLLQDVLALNDQIFKSMTNDLGTYGYHPDNQNEVNSNVIMDKRA